MSMARSNSTTLIGLTRIVSHTLSVNFMPDRKIGVAPSFAKSMRTVILSSWLNVLCVCIPISWALHFALPSSDTNDTIVFVFSFIAIIPLAKLLAFATDELSMRVGQTLAGLLNATLGNAVELIVSIIALIKCQLQVVQSSLVGSILSNILLVLGMCFFAGGVRFSEQGFGISSVQLNASLLTVSVIGVLLPAAFHFLIDTSSSPANNATSSISPVSNATEAGWILSVSHSTALILLFIYACYLTFQLGSHKRLYDPDSEVPKTVQYEPKEKRTTEKRTFKQYIGFGSAPADGLVRTESPQSSEPADVESGHGHPVVDGLAAEGSGEDDEEDEEEIPQMSLWATIFLLVFVTVLVGVTAEFLVDSINGLTASGHISKEFVGLILLPIVGNAAEHVTAVTVSVKDKLTLSLGVAVGSSIQIALFVIPLIVTLAWMMGKPLTMLFDPLESLSLFFAVLVVNYTTQDGKSNWLEGTLLMCLYIILAVMFWYYPGTDTSKLLGLSC
ncbi:hypothetical protein EUX98_g3903 [Antrodiella citrinella]|uniref:Sodium/calcium exchanger membrane region domain-containing protein n=1 Tax=Antrodiella citrinella TaxID=2447956 RepID=A0A4S4MY68_9APHY|nr:hypothetical protein EUX98_g3903 [Antrodiella citrinella]